MKFSGITDKEFTATVKANPTDEARGPMVQEGGSLPHQQVELTEWNEMMLTRGPSTPDKQKYFNKLRDAVDPTRTDLTAWSDLQDLEEGRTVPKR